MNIKCSEVNKHFVRCKQCGKIYLKDAIVKHLSRKHYHVMQEQYEDVM